jgi:hypothetical protein
MDSFTLLLSLVRTVAITLSAGKGDVAEYAGYLALGTSLAARGREGHADLQALHDQVTLGMTPEQRATLKARGDAASSELAKWLADNPA